MHTDSPLSEKIWEGNRAAIAEARERFHADTGGQLIPWVSTLYSFRQLAVCREELYSFVPALVLICEATPPMIVGGRKATADQADVISTILLWAYRTGCTEPSQGRMFLAARHAALYGFDLAERTEAEGGHTLALLALTRAEWTLTAPPIRKMMRRSAQHFLEVAESRASSIKDANQKVRVYRKLGYLYLRLGYPLGLWYVFRAAAMKSTADARRKTLFFWRR
jgi:hypothetical protein